MSGKGEFKGTCSNYLVGLAATGFMRSPRTDRQFSLTKIPSVHYDWSGHRLPSRFSPVAITAANGALLGDAILRLPSP
jgi:hypothetical protein